MHTTPVRVSLPAIILCAMCWAASARQLQWSGCDIRQQTSNANAQPSTGSVQRVADDFVPALSGQVTGIVLWGCYDGDIADEFTVKYYTDLNGLPGQVVGTYSQLAGTLTVTPGVRTGALIAGVGLPVYIYSASHAPQAVQSGQTYWIEITNGASDWFWVDSNAGNLRSVLSLSSSGPYVNPQFYTDRAFTLGIVSACAGDTNGDNVVDFADLSAVLSAFGQTRPAGCAGDVNGDGQVNFADISVVLGAFGRRC